jgi:dihydrofolate synthase/folylpolyglutamate synthase
VNPSLESIRALCSELGDPQSRFASIQITGTNGKTSTARFTEALLRAQGLKTGLYTSPELQRYPERIEIGGKVVSDDDFALAVGVAVEAAHALLGEQGATEFELLTLAALWLFAEKGVEVAVLEVGMGGRWDATSVVNAKVAVVTGVGLDHTRVLGDTTEQIAAEKAAIIKRGSVAVLGPGTEGLERLFLAQAARVGAPLVAVRERGASSPADEDRTVRYTLEDTPASPGGITTVAVHTPHGIYPALSVVGPAYQAPNVATALAAAEAYIGGALDPAAAASALRASRAPGRFELVGERPPVVIDAAHNPQGAAALADAIAAAWPDPQVRPALLLGVLSDKDAAGIVTALAPVVGAIAVTASSSPRAIAPDALALIVEEVTGVAPQVFATVAEGTKAMVAAHPEGLVVSGSITVAGEARSSIA